MTTNMSPQSSFLERFLELMQLYIKRSRLITRLAEQTEKAQADREGRDVGSMRRFKTFGDHRMFVRMKLQGMNSLAELLPHGGPDEKARVEAAHPLPEVTEYHILGEEEAMYN